MRKEVKNIKNLFFVKEWFKRKDTANKYKSCTKVCCHFNCEIVAFLRQTAKSFESLNKNVFYFLKKIIFNIDTLFSYAWKIK